jgi:DNA-binding transcriptional regulator YiaG
MTGKDVTGKEVKAVRKALGFSQRVFAIVLGYKRGQTISEIENGSLEASRAAMIIVAILKLLLRIEAVLVRIEKQLNDD